MSTTEQQIIEASREIGGIAGSNCHFTAGLARLFDNGDQRFLDTSIKDFISIYREYQESFNRVHGTSEIEKPC